MFVAAIDSICYSASVTGPRAPTSTFACTESSRNKYSNQRDHKKSCHAEKQLRLYTSTRKRRLSDWQQQVQKGCVGEITISQKKKGFDVQIKYKVSIQTLYTYMFSYVDGKINKQPSINYQNIRPRPTHWRTRSFFIGNVKKSRGISPQQQAKQY